MNQAQPTRMWTGQRKQGMVAPPPWCAGAPPNRNRQPPGGIESRSMNGIQIVDIAHAIQLALAPVFLLSGIGVLLGVLTNRLARTVDRARKVEESLRQATTPDVAEARAQLRVASRRARFINFSITLCTIAALLVAMVVALLFSSTFAPINLAAYVAALFVAAMIALVGALLSFLVEIRIATAALRIGGNAAKLHSGAE
jgi:MFS family permease